MARQVLPIVGAVVGAYFGNPQLGYAIGSIIGNAVDPQVIEGPALGEGQVNTAREGGYRPIVLGTGCVGCNIINVGPEKIRTHRERQSKGGGPVSETKRRYRTFALRICEGPIAGLLRIWQGEKLVYDVRPDSVIPADSAKYAEGFTFYLGDEDQLPDPDLEAYLGAGNVNAYRGTAYIVFTNFDLTDTQGAIPNFRFEVSNGVTIDQSGWVMTAANDEESPIAEGHKVWSSGDLVSWAGPFDRITDPIDHPTYGAFRTANGLLIAGEDSVIEVTTDLVFPDGMEISRTDTLTSPSIGRLRTFGNIVVAMKPSNTAGNKYWTREGSGPWTERTVPSNPVSGGGLVDVARLDFGRWVGVLSDGPSTRFIFSDDEGAPASWFNASGGFPATGGSIACNGNMAAYLGTIGRISETIDGATWSLATTLAGADQQGGRDASQFSDTLFLAVESSGGSGIAKKEEGGGWSLVMNPLPGFQVQRMSYGDGKLVVSLPSSIFDGGIQRDCCVSSDEADTFQWLTLPDTTANKVRVAYFQVSLDPGTITLASIISFIHRRCGHAATQYDVTELTDPVDGVVFADSYTGSDAIRTILPIYFADASEHDAGGGYKINYIKRGKPVVRTLVLDDLVDEPEEAVRQDSLERAAKFHLHFQNPTIGYAAAKATSSRSSPDVTSNVTGEVSVQVPITFADPTEAAQRSNILHKVSWVEVGGTQEIMISDADMDLVPTDVIGLYLRGILTRYRMVTQQYVDGTLKCEFMADRQSAYTSNVTGIPLPEPEPPPSSIVGPTVSVFGDWPALVDGHDALISYAAATGQTPAWWGATYQRSLDAGANFTTAATFDDFNTIMGVLQETLPDASEHYTDTTNSVRVTLYTDDQIESLTAAQFLSEGGGFALSWENSEGTQWEMLQYRDAEQDSNGDWILSHLLRGRLDTETAEHPPGATFVLLDNSLKVMPMQSAWLGMDLTHRAYSNGETPESAVPYDDEFTGKSQREWPVANLLLERDGDDIEAAAIPRHRFGTDDAPVQSVNHSGYRWTATDGVNTVNIDTVVPTQTFDATGWGSPVTVTVAQLNRITGAGPSVSEEIV